jgi:hypothetical protein
MSENNVDNVDPLLHRKWCFYFFNSTSTQTDATSSINKNYQGKLFHTNSIESVRSFWRYFNNLPLVSKLWHGNVIFSFMEIGREPSWEKNSDGGTVRYSLHHCNLDETWLYTLLVLIGEQLSDSVCACLDGVSIRPNHGYNAALTFWFNKEPPSSFYTELIQLVPSYKVFKYCYLSNRQRLLSNNVIKLKEIQTKENEVSKS